MALVLKQKEEYELVHAVIDHMLQNLVKSRLIEPLSPKTCWDPNTFGWAKAADLDALNVKWYIPSEKEMKAAQFLVDKYLPPCLEALENHPVENLASERETVLKRINLAWQILLSTVEVLPEIEKGRKITSLKDNLATMFQDKLEGLTVRGAPLRIAMYKVSH